VNEVQTANGKESLRRRTRLWVLLAFVAPWVCGLIAFQIWKSASVPSDVPTIGLSLDSAWYSHLGYSQASFETALTRVDARTFSFRTGDHPPAEILDQIDALLLCGGGDVDPARYGGDSGNTYSIDPAHDRFEEELIRGALERDMPILGICRGIQILNVVHGGTLRNLHEDSRLSATHGIDLDSFRAHAIQPVEGSLLASIIGSEPREVNSFHGHAVGRIGHGLTAAAVSPDGVIEAVERPDRAFVIGIQWHPEISSLTDADALAIFRELVDAARRYRAEQPE
jgi:gamma-glutamyl-gamma-aminobutyrate hydrolase PuuD